MTWVQLTSNTLSVRMSRTRGKYWLNLDQIVSMTPMNGYTLLKSSSGEQHEVKETVAQIRGKTSSAHQ